MLKCTVPAGNNNCNRPLADESFYKALSVLKPDDVKGKICEITEDYVSVHDATDDDSEDIFYDARMQRVVKEKEWSAECYKHTVEQERERKRALEKQGLLEAFTALELYLQNHNSIKTTDYDISDEGRFTRKIVERDLSYGYKLTGFRILDDAVLWEITTYERPIKENDCIRGCDDCCLMFKNGIIVEVTDNE